MNQLELDALELEDEDEGTSYLADLNKAPDYLDEEPAELNEVSTGNPGLLYMLIRTVIVGESKAGSSEDNSIIRLIHLRHPTLPQLVLL